MTPLHKLKEWAEESPSYCIKPSELLAKIEELLPEERQGLNDAFNGGNDWTYSNFHDYFTQKYGSTQNK